MWKLFLAVAGLCSMMVSCDVRKKDKLAPLPPQEIKDPTTIQLIDSVFDFGKIEEGKTVEFSYRFKNTGTNPLIVTDVTATCGCTVAEKPEEPVKPGDIGYVKVKFNSENRPGEARKTVTVHSNANPPFPGLLLKGQVTGKQ